MMFAKQSLFISISVFIISIALAPLFVDSHSSGPLNGKTGAPGEGLCSDCHGSSQGAGSLTIVNAPNSYLPGTLYSIIVELEDVGQKRWGFELTALTASGDGVGTFLVTDNVNTQLSAFAPPTRSYMKHTSTGTYLGTDDGPVSWTFNWMAPNNGMGDITFYVAGNGANGNFSTTGDFIYTASHIATLGNIQNCCGQFTNGQSGNTDCDVEGKRNLADITRLIDRVYITKQGLCCDQNGNVDGDNEAKINLADITALIDHVYISKLETAPCL